MIGAVITSEKAEGKLYVLDCSIAEGYGTRYLCVEFTPDAGIKPTFGPPILVLPSEITEVISMPLQIHLMSGQIQANGRLMAIVTPSGIIPEASETPPETNAFKP